MVAGQDLQNHDPAGGLQLLLQHPAVPAHLSPVRLEHRDHINGGRGRSPGGLQSS